jgi:hypothetical protein
MFFILLMQRGEEKKEGDCLMPRDCPDINFWRHVKLYCFIFVLSFVCVCVLVNVTFIYNISTTCDKKPCFIVTGVGRGGGANADRLPWYASGQNDGSDAFDIGGDGGGDGDGGGGGGIGDGGSRGSDGGGGGGVGGGGGGGGTLVAAKHRRIDGARKRLPPSTLVCKVLFFIVTFLLFCCIHFRSCKASTH